jgi:hypothetical protein
MVERVALEDFDGDGTSVAITEQSVDNLQTAAVLIPRIAAHSNRAGMPLEVRRRQIVQNQRGVTQMPSC